MMKVTLAAPKQFILHLLFNKALKSKLYTCFILLSIIMIIKYFQDSKFVESGTRKSIAPELKTIFMSAFLIKPV